jgi:hypothetical protein
MVGRLSRVTYKSKNDTGSIGNGDWSGYLFNIEALFEAIFGSWPMACRRWAGRQEGIILVGWAQCVILQLCKGGAMYVCSYRVAFIRALAG